MTLFPKIFLVSLRVSLGWLMFYAGITKVLNPEWSAAGFLVHAKTFSGFYQSLAQPAFLPYVNVLNEWGLTLIGASLILGISVRLSSILGALMMVLYYFPVLEFPYIPEHSYLVDEHIIYALAFLSLAALRAGSVWGMGGSISNLPMCARFPTLKKFLE